MNKNEYKLRKFCWVCQHYQINEDASKYCRCGAGWEYVLEVDEYFIINKTKQNKVNKKKC